MSKSENILHYLFNHTYPVLFTSSGNNTCPDTRPGTHPGNNTSPDTCPGTHPGNSPGLYTRLSTRTYPCTMYMSSYLYLCLYLYSSSSLYLYSSCTCTRRFTQTRPRTRTCNRLLRSSSSQTQANIEDLRHKLDDRRVVLKSGMVEGEEGLEPQKKKLKGMHRKDMLLNVMSQFLTELAKD